MFDWFSFEFVKNVYFTGWLYSFILFAFACVLFGIFRWYKCVRKYIETGEIDKSEKTWFVNEDNWFYGSKDQYHYGTEPWTVGIDIPWMIFLSAILTAVWPVSVITTIVIVYAKTARQRFVNKQLFIEKLKGEETETSSW